MGDYEPPAPNLTYEQVMNMLKEWIGNRPTVHTVRLTHKDESSIVVTVELPVNRRLTDKEAVEAALLTMKHPGYWKARIPVGRRPLR